MMEKAPIVKIKVCGITNLEDALFCIKNKIDYIGFNFYEKSPRYILPKKAKEIKDKLPRSKTKFVGVFVNESIAGLCKIAREVGLNLLQLHGDENSKYILNLRCKFPKAKIIRAIRVKEKASLGGIGAISSDYILFDNYSRNKYGGTGASFYFNFLKGISRGFFLSGGVNAMNLHNALKLMPFAIDVNSGIESTPGKKDSSKIIEILKIMRDKK